MYVACAVFLTTISLVLAVPSIRFSRDLPNAITLKCRRGGITGDQIQNAIFRRDGVPLTTTAGPRYSFDITQNTEGSYTCHEIGQLDISSELRLAGVCNNLEVLYYNASGVKSTCFFAHNFVHEMLVGLATPN